MTKRKPIVIPGSKQTWAMQTLTREGALLEVSVTCDWAHVQHLARKALGNKTRRAALGPISVRVVHP